MKEKSKWLNRIYKKFDKHFKNNLPCSFHNLLWQIMINETTKGKVVVFYPVITPEGTEMVLASGTGGYNETGVMFKSNDWKESLDFCMSISLLVFHKDIGGLLSDEGDWEQVINNSFGIAA